ncbi:uncharacterized protein LOC116952972 isoform X1 [Petromyzon marinus]|uniref:uncharacterized protein LOC116952972 isoform X1 n=2 Tax=Petromyzon marinus TaxID=7757 RepID=UPI003F6E664D
MARNEGPSAHRVPALSPRAATSSGRLFTIREQDEGRGGGGRPNRRWKHVPSSLKVTHDYRSPPSGKDTIRRGECGGRGDRDDGRGDSGSGGNGNFGGWGSGRLKGRDGGNSGGSGHGSDGKSGGGSGGGISGGGSGSGSGGDGGSVSGDVSGSGSCDIDGGGIGDSGSGGVSHCGGGRDAGVGGSVGHEPNHNGTAGVPVAKMVVEKRLRFEPKVSHSHGKQSHSKGVRKQRQEAHGPRAVSVVLSKVSPGGSPTCKYAGGAVESARASSENGACLFVAGYVTSISARTTKSQERPSRAKPSRHIAASTPGRTRLEDRSSPESRANSTPPPAMANKAGADNGGAKTDERVRLAKERRQELEKMQASRGELFQEKERKARELYERFMAERRRRLAEQRQREEERRVAVDEKRRQKLAEDKARYEASISRAQEKGPPRRDPRNRWSWGGALPSNHTASPRKHHDTPDRRSVSTVNLSRHPPDSVVSKRLSMSSATLLNSPDRPGSSGKRKKTNGRRSQLTPMEMSIVSRLLTPTHSSLARSRSVATLSGEGHCPVFPVCPRSAFASPVLTPTHSKQQHRHRSRSQERRFKPFSTPSPLVERLKKEKRISSPGAGLSASPILRPPRRSEPPPRSCPQTGGTTTPVTSGKTSGPVRANHPSPAATAAFVSSKPPSGPQTPRPRVDRKDAKDVKEAKEVKDAKEKKETKAEKERANAATAKDEKRPAIAKKPKLSSPPAAGSKVATPNGAAPVSPLPPPSPLPQAAGGYREKAAMTPATERRGADGAPAEVVEAPAAAAVAAAAPVPVVEEKEEEKPGAERARGEMMRMPTIVVEEAPPVVDSDESEEPTASGWFDETAAAGTKPTVSTQEAPAGGKRQGDQSPVDGKPSPKDHPAADGAGRESGARTAETTGPVETARPPPPPVVEAAAATATAAAATKTPKKSGAAEGDAARPSAATEEAATRTPVGKGRSDEAKASSGGGGGKSLAGSTNAEDATRALAEKRKLAREQREKEEQERIAHAEAEKRMKEEIARRKAEERARREEEARRLEDERRVQEEEERRRAEEERERRETEERERQVEIQKQREEAEVRAREEAEKQRVERARQAHKEEQERLERKKRLEQIMKRTRKSEPNKEKEGGKDLEDTPDQQSNGDTGDSPGLLSLNGQTHAREAPTGNGSAAVGSLTTEGSNGRDFEELIDLAMEPRSMKAAVTAEGGDAAADTVGSASAPPLPPNPPLIAFEENGDSLA